MWGLEKRNHEGCAIYTTSKKNGHRYYLTGTLHRESPDS